MTDEFLVRPASAADREQIHALARGVKEGPNWTEAHYDELFVDSKRGPLQRVLLVALSDTVLVGLCVLSLIVDECEIENLIVARELRRRGIGSKLCRESLRWSKAEGATQARLEVRASNAGAISLYQSVGFMATGVRKNYYCDPAEDALLMQASLSDATDLQ